MDSFEFNKIAAGFLICLIVAMISSLLGDYFIHPKTLTKVAIKIDMPDGMEEGQAPSHQSQELEPIAPLLAHANLENGKNIVEKKCAQCHTHDKGGVNKIGPNLWNVVGRESGHIADFAYSAAVKNLGIKWSFEDLGKFLYRPRKFAEGTKMSFPGLSKAQDRADVIAFLRSQSDAPAPLPDAGAVKNTAKPAA